MAAKHLSPKAFLLLLFHVIAAAALDRRFSDFKRCTDSECSMLLCRGKAVQDFSGPDCRFLSFKKSETIYVYYKLSGRRTDLWAGSVGSHFGYFPKDLLAVNHLYTEKELEVPAEETDFVCFDNGFDKFDNYNIDLLLGSSLEVNENKELSEQVPDDTTEERQLSPIEAADTENPFEPHDNSEDIKRKLPDDQSAVDSADSENPVELQDNSEDLERNVPDDRSASLTKLDVTPEPSTAKVVEFIRTATSDSFEQAESDAKVDQEKAVESFPENVVSQTTETKDTPTVSEVEPVPKDQKKYEEKEPVSVSEGVQIPELKTTFGSTFDAVTTDEEITKKVTPYEEEESKSVENQRKDDVDVKAEIPLLSFSEEPVPEDQKKYEEKEPVSVSEGVQIPELKTTFGSTFDAVTTDEEITKKVTPYEEEESKSVENQRKDEVDVKAEIPLLSFSEEPVPEDQKKYEEKEPVSVSEGVQIPELKTTFGTTFDAVTTDEEITKKVTPYEEEESKSVENQRKDDVDVKVKIPLLSSSEEPANTSASDTMKQQHILPTTNTDKLQTTDHNMRTSIGDTVLSVVTGEEATAQDLSSEEEDDEEEKDEEEEKAATKTILSLEKAKKDVELNILANTDDEKSKIKTTPQSATENKEEKVSSDLEINEDNATEDKQEEKVSSDSEIGEDNVNEGTEAEEGLSNSEISEENANEDEEEDEVSDNSEISEDNANEDEEEDEEEDEVSDNSEINEGTAHEEKEEDEVSDNSEISEDNANEDEEEDEVSDNSEISEDSAEEDEVSENSEINEGIATEEKEEVSKNSETSEDNVDKQDSSVVVEHKQKLDKVLDKNKMFTNQQSAIKESEKGQDLSTEKTESKNVFKNEEKIVDASLPDDKHPSLLTDLHNNNSQPKILVAEPETHKELHTEETEEKNDQDMEEDHNEEKELLEDENAILLAQSENTESDRTSAGAETPPTELTPEPEYSDSVRRLTLLREHFTEEHMQRFQKHLGINNLVKVEAMFSDLDTELQATRLSQSGTNQDIENALESILEASENTILDEVEKMLDNRASKQNDNQQDISDLDEETEILDDFQELAFSLRNKYSAANESTPLATEKASDMNKVDEHNLLDKEDMPHIAEKDKVDNVTETESDGNLTETSHEERPADTQEKQKVLDEAHPVPDVSVEEDGGRFNKNEDNQPGFTDSDKMQKVPQATLENPLDMGLGVEVENSPSGSLDSMDPVSEIHDKEVGSFSTGMVYLNCILSMIKSKIEEWTIVMISLLPEEWKPGQTLFGCPWQAVVITALVGVVTFTLFFWRTVLAIKKREYLVDEKRLTEQIQTLKKEKNDALEKMSELQKQADQLKENQKQSKETVSSTVKKMQNLESKVSEAETRNKQMVDEKNTYIKLLEEERTNSVQNLTRIEKLEKANEKLQLNRKKIQEALTKTTVLLDEAKIREDARNVHQKCLEKEYATVKEENKTLKVTIKEWEDKHKELSEQIKVYHKSQKELEDSVVLKDHNVEVLSELLADLEACDLQKGDTKVLANGEIAPDKKTAIKNRIKHMMDVSRVQTTLTVVEEERDRFMSKLLNEEKTRKELEEQHQELEHAIATLKSEKSHVENQFKILQQKNEIMVEMYQQKENALQQRLTKEELERRSKENLLSEVGGKALEVEEQVKILRQRICEMEEQMKKTEEVYKEQIKEQENKTHSNWVNARNAERALNQEKLESSKLREKLAVLTSQLNERRAPLFRPNSGQPAGPRQGDSYGPSPVSGGAPSPPTMIEGPRRPPSAPVGRRIDPYGPRPPSDPHGRYPENKHMAGMDMMGPRSSSPANMDTSTQAVDPQIKAETQAEPSTECPEPGPGSFLASPIRDSPAPMVQGPPLGPGPHDPLLPPGPPGRLPPPGLYRAPRPGLYHLPPGPHGPPPPNLPANGHPGMPLPGPMGGEFGPRPTNGHAFHPRPGPGPLPPHFRPPLPHHLGPMSPPTGVRGHIGARPPIPPDMRFAGPRDHTGPPMDMATGFPPHPANAYGQAPPDANSGPGQDLHVKQEAPQDSARPAMVKP